MYSKAVNLSIGAIFIKADILLLPDLSFVIRLIFPQVPLLQHSRKFSVQSSPMWIEEKAPTPKYILSLLDFKEMNFFGLK